MGWINEMKVGDAIGKKGDGKLGVERVLGFIYLFLLLVSLSFGKCRVLSV